MFIPLIQTARRDKNTLRRRHKLEIRSEGILRIDFLCDCLIALAVCCCVRSVVLDEVHVVLAVAVAVEAVDYLGVVCAVDVRGYVFVDCACD